MLLLVTSILYWLSWHHGMCSILRSIEWRHVGDYSGELYTVNINVTDALVIPDITCRNAITSTATLNLDNQICKSWISSLPNWSCINNAFYPFSCMALWVLGSNNNWFAQNWCSWSVMSAYAARNVQNTEMRQTTKQSLSGHIARMPYKADAGWRPLPRMTEGDPRTSLGNMVQD